MPRAIHVSGSQAAVNNATQLINYVIENGPHLPPVGPGGGLPVGMGKVIMTTLLLRVH